MRINTHTFIEETALPKPFVFGSIVLRCHSYDDNKVLVTLLPYNSRFMHRT